MNYDDGGGEGLSSASFGNSLLIHTLVHIEDQERVTVLFTLCLAFSGLNGVLCMPPMAQ